MGDERRITKAPGGVQPVEGRRAGAGDLVGSAGCAEHPIVGKLLVEGRQQAVAAGLVAAPGSP